MITNVPKMTPQELEERAHARWGKGWKRPLARALGYDPKTIRNYLNGEQTIPLHVAEQVRGLVDPVADTVTAAVLKVKPATPKRTAISIGQQASTDLAGLNLTMKKNL